MAVVAVLTIVPFSAATGFGACQSASRELRDPPTESFSIRKPSGCVSCNICTLSKLEWAMAQTRPYKTIRHYQVYVCKLTDLQISLVGVGNKADSAV